MSTQQFTEDANDFILPRMDDELCFSDVQSITPEPGSNEEDIADNTVVERSEDEVEEDQSIEPLIPCAKDVLEDIRIQQMRLAKRVLKSIGASLRLLSFDGSLSLETLVNEDPRLTRLPLSYYDDVVPLIEQKLSEKGFNIVSEMIREDSKRITLSYKVSFSDTKDTRTQTDEPDESLPHLEELDDDQQTVAVPDLAENEAFALFPRFDRHGVFSNRRCDTDHPGISATILIDNSIGEYKDSETSSSLSITKQNESRLAQVDHLAMSLPRYVDNVETVTTDLENITMTESNEPVVRLTYLEEKNRVVTIAYQVYPELSGTKIKFAASIFRKQSEKDAFVRKQHAHTARERLILRPLWTDFDMEKHLRKEVHRRGVGAKQRIPNSIDAKNRHQDSETGSVNLSEMDHSDCPSRIPVAAAAPTGVKPSGSSTTRSTVGLHGCYDVRQAAVVV